MGDNVLCRHNISTYSALCRNSSFQRNVNGDRELT